MSEKKDKKSKAKKPTPRDVTSDLQYTVTMPDSTTTQVTISDPGGTQDDVASFMCGVTPDGFTVSAGTAQPGILARNTRRFRVSLLATDGETGTKTYQSRALDDYKSNPRGPQFTVSTGTGP